MIMDKSLPSDFWIYSTCGPRLACYLTAVLTVLTVLGAVGAEQQREPEAAVFISEPPSHVTFSNVQGVMLPCTAYGFPAPEMDWVHEDGTSVDAISGILQIFSNNSLYLHPFQDAQFRPEVHAGKYRCTATNTAGVLFSRVVQLNAVLLNQYKSYNVHVNDVYVTSGNTAVFKCAVNPYYMRQFVHVDSWTASGKSLTSGGRYSVLSSGDLHVRAVTAEDIYQAYRCITKNHLTGEEKASEPASLYFIDAVNSAPAIEDTLPALQANLGETLELPCAASGFPLPAYTWSKDGVAVPLDQVHTAQLGGNLLIREAGVQDSGEYTCTARNNLGRKSTVTNLTVRAPLSVFIDPVQQVVDVGNPAIFNCTVSGNPVKTITWLKDGLSLVVDDRVQLPTDTLLVIRSVQRVDKGIYQCVAGNDRDNAQGSSQLMLGVSRPVLIHGFTEEFTRPGPTVSFTCTVAGNPTPNVRWTRDDQPLPVDDRYRAEVYISEDDDVISNVTIKNIVVEDGGEYRCVAENAIGSVDYAGRLNIYGAPYIRPMGNVTAVANEMLRIRCHVSGYPIEAIVWHKGTSILPINHRQQVHEDGLLEVSSVARSADAGSYTCTASSPDGQTVSQSVHVHILEPPRIDAFLFPSRKEGDRVSVSCVVSSGDLPIAISWQKDGRPIPPDLGVFIQMTGDYSSMLSIGHASPRHNGNYTCVASNQAAVTNLTASFHVDVPPRWVSEPQDTFVVLYKSLRLDCQTAGTPEPTVIWKKARGEGPGDYVDIDFDHPTHVHLAQLANGSLVIGEAREEDHGYYLCHSSNGVGSALSKVVFITVHVPARFDGPMRNATVVLGRNTTLECRAVGDTPMSLSWSHNGQALDLPRGNRVTVSYFLWERGRGSKLHIMSARREDSGFLVCHAQNMFGSDALMTQLLVQESPEAPSAVRIRTSNSRSVVITWSAPFDGNTPINSYIVQYKNSSEAWASAERIRVDAEDFYAMVDDLHPAYEYNIRVLANNSVGLGDPSDIISVITGQEAPTGAPNNVIAIATGSKSILITWQAPDPLTCNGKILGYYIGYKKFNVTSPYMYVTKATNDDFVPEVTLSDLEKFTMYSIHVQAYNMKGAGPRSRDVSVLTLEDVPSQAPQSVQATPLSSQSLMVLWSPPPLYTLHGILQGYKIHYKPVREDEDERDANILVTSKLSSAIYGLEKYTNYSVQVLAYTRKGDGVPCEAIYVMTQPDLPERPADIKALAAGPTSIIVSWRPPLRINGVLLKYVLVMQALDQSNQTSELVMELFPATHSYLAINLETNRRYSFKVQAATVVGHGDFTHEVEASPMARVSAQIASFTKKVHVPWRDDVIFPCEAVGDPAPSVIWKKENQQIVSNGRIHIYSNGSLTISNLEPTDGANYTCRAENQYGADQIRVALVVQVNGLEDSPPQSPALSIAMTTSSSIQVTWRSGSNGGSRIQGFFLSYKREHGEWQRTALSAHNRSHVLTGLRCGTKYLFKMSAYNRVGEGGYSDLLTARTNGSAPVMPPQNMLIYELNATYVTLDLDTWMDAGCPVTSYDIRFRVWGSEPWETVENHIEPSKRFYRVDIHPATWYVIKVTAHNEAGSTDCDIKFASPTHGGSTIKPMKIIHRTHLPFHQRPDVIIPLVACIVLIVVGIVAFVLCYKRRRHKLSYKEQNANNLRRDLTAETSLTMDSDKQVSSDYITRSQHYTPLPSADWRRNQESHDTQNLNNSNDEDQAGNLYASYIYGCDDTHMETSPPNSGTDESSCTSGNKYDAMASSPVEYKDPRYQNFCGTQVPTISGSSSQLRRPKTLPGVKRLSFDANERVQSPTEHTRTTPRDPRQPRDTPDGRSGEQSRSTYALYIPSPKKRIRSFHNDAESEEQPIYEQFQRPKSGAYEYISEPPTKPCRKSSLPSSEKYRRSVGSEPFYRPRMTSPTVTSPRMTSPTVTSPRMTSPSSPDDTQVKAAYIDKAASRQDDICQPGDTEEKMPLFSKSQETPENVHAGGHDGEKSTLLNRKYQPPADPNKVPASSRDVASKATSPYHDTYTVV